MGLQGTAKKLISDLTMFCFSGKKLYRFAKGWFLFFLLFITFLITQNAQAAETSEFVPEPEITSFKNEQTLSGDVVVSGTSINYSQVKVYLDNTDLGYAHSEIGTLGWQDFEMQLPNDMVFGQHRLECITEYFKNTNSATTTLEFYYQPKFPAPTLFNPVLNSETNFQQPWIVGLSFNDSYLEFYIDDQYVSQTLIENHESGIANFKFKPVKKLSRGFHTVKVRAISLDGRQSDFSNEIIFEVRQGASVLSAPELLKEVGEFIAPVPAPTLVEPKNGSVQKDGTLLVTGLMHNEHFIKVYIDEKLTGEFMPDAHPSGVTSFIWQAEQVLESGMHKVWVTATNPRGQQSGQSNILRFIVLPAEHFVSQGGQIAAVTEEQPAADIQIEQETLIDKITNGVNGVVDKINNWSNWWKYLIALIIIVALILIITWVAGHKKEKAEPSNSAGKEEKVDIKTKDDKDKDDKPKTGNDLTSEPKKDEPIIQGPEITYDVKDKKADDEEYVPPPPPPDSPTLGI